MATHRLMTAPGRRSNGAWCDGHRHLEIVALGALLVVAFATRIGGGADIEPNILPDEADHLSTIYRIIAGRGPGPLELSWDGNPAFQLYPPIPFVLLVEPDYVGLRLAVAFASVLMLAAFYLVIRWSCSALAAWAATGLLAWSQWALIFSRNGEVNMYVALYAMLAAWSLQRALDGRRWLPWGVAGFWAGMGWYGFLAGVLILPSLVGPLPFWLIRRPAERRRLLRGYGVLVAVFVLTVLPRAPVLWERRDDVQRYVDGRSILHGVPVAEAPGVLLAQVGRTVRAFLVLDPTLEGNPRYLGPNRSSLDGATGTLYVGGLALAAWGRGGSALWWSLLLVPLAATQILTTNIPDLARSIAALPAAFLFVGVAIDRLLRGAPLGPLVRAAVIVAVPAIGWSNWQEYTSWLATPAAAQARQPAIEYGEVDEWRDEQQRRAVSAERGLTVTEWREQHPRPTASSDRARQSRPGPRPRQGPLAIAPLFAVEASRGVAQRGVVVAESGEVLVSDATGRVSRLDPAGTSLVPLPQAVGARLAQAWDLAAAPDGSLYLAESERGIVVKLDSDGRVAATLGAAWGMYRPRGLAIGPEGRLYVADTGRNRIVVASLDGRLISTLAPADLEQPTDIAVDDGRIYVALPELGRVDILDDSGRRLGGWPISKGNTVEAPHLTVTAQGEIVVSEPTERRVRIFDPSGRQIGQIDTGLAGPFAVASVAARLYVTDPASGRVLGYSLGE